MKNLFKVLILFILIHFTASAQVIRFVAPNGIGNADGSRGADAAAFWQEVQGLLQQQPVTVKFSVGVYERAYRVRGSAGLPLFTDP